MRKHSNTAPPRLALKLFQWYCRPDRVEELQGDLEEFFFLRVEEGHNPWVAKLFFWWNVIRCYRSYAKVKTQNNLIMQALFKSYFKLAVRHSWKNKWAVLVNVLGLGIALSMCIFVYSIYAYNFEFDTFYEEVDDVYRVNVMTFENGQERRNELSPFPFDRILREDIAGIQQVSSFYTQNMNVKRGNEFFEEFVGVVSEDFFEMFEMPLWYGSLEGFAEQPIVYLTKPTAKRLLGDEVAIGQKLTLYVSSSYRLEVIVGGVFERIPLNQSFDVNMIVSWPDFIRTRGIDPNNWDLRWYTAHYLRMSKEQIPIVEKALSEYIPRQNESHEAMKITSLELVPFMSSIHSNDNMYRNQTNIRLSADVQIIFTVLTLLVFLIACFNLANTSMAMIAKRLKEIGIRKTLGSENRQILIQFLLEMGFVCFLSFIVAVSMVDLTSNFIMGLFGETFLVRDISLGGVITFIVAFLVFTTLVAGLLPALYAWKFQPVAIMRKSVKLRGINWLNKSLTVAQYSFSIAVLAAGISFSRNSEFLDQLNPGYANENVYVLDLGTSDRYEEMKQGIDQLTGVEAIGTRNHIANFGRMSSTRLLEIDTTSTEVRTYTVGDLYLDFMEIPVIEGRDFIAGSVLDQQSSIIVNQEFASRYFDGNATNQVVKVGGERKTVVGVFPDLIQDVYSDAEKIPAVFMLDTAKQYRRIITKIDHSRTDELESQLRELWSAQIDAPYDGQWQKELGYGSAVRDTENLRIIFTWMAALGGFLSLVGIFSLAKLNVAKKLKEISIRKVLGSSLNQLLVSVNRPFFIVLAISMVLGTALGYLISDLVLSMIYTYYADISTITTLLCGLFIVMISGLIITISVVSPANANPVVGLREE